MRYPDPTSSRKPYLPWLFISRNPAVWISKRKFITCMTVFLLISMLAGIKNGEAETLFFASEQKKMIVIDPGHGGYDTGAQGPEGTLEKTTTLSFGRMLADELGGKYRLHLTRADDYRLEIPKRTAVANHLKADLFISIHAGGSFLHKASGISIFYYNEISDPAMAIETESAAQTEASDTKISWNHIQNRHKTTSSVAAQLIRRRLLDPVRSNKIRIHGAPLMVLKGADMPAILIEVGYLTNPAEEKKLQDSKVLSDLAKSISNGIDDFFKSTFQGN
ncbi:N-acetylmuramoyl-L-alanine amidase [Thermodesulfobacteriota bacterium]